MNKQATRAKFEDNCISISKWCRKHGFEYQAVMAMLSRPSDILETKRQRRIIDAMIADGLYVPSSDEVAA